MELISLIDTEQLLYIISVFLILINGVLGFQIDLFIFKYYVTNSDIKYID